MTFSLITTIGQALAGPIHFMDEWGGSPMLTTGIAWFVLTGGVVLLTLSLGARSPKTLRRMKEIAIALSASAGLAGILLWGNPGGEQSGVIHDNALMMMAAAGMGILTLILVSGRALRRGQPPCETDRGEAELWSAATRAVTESPTLNQMLLGVASALRAATSARSALVYKHDVRHGTVLFAGTASSDCSADDGTRAGQAEESIARQSVTDGRVTEYTHDTENRRSRSPRRWIGIPLRVDDRVLGAILLSEPASDPGSEAVTQLLANVGMLAARAMSDWADASSGVGSSRCMEKLNELSHALIDEHSFERALPQIAKALDGLVAADYLSVAWLDRARFHEDRTSMVVGEQLIVENRRRWPIWDGTTNRLLNMDRPLITPDLAYSSDSTMEGGAWEKRLGLRSRIVVPIRDTERLLGSITLAHRDAKSYGQDESAPLAALAAVVGTWLKRLEADRQAQRYHEATRLANEWDRDPFRWTDEAGILQDAQRVIRTSALRLYRVSADGLSLEMLGSAGRAAKEMPLGNRIALADVPWHRWSMADRAPRRINQSDPESIMDKGEVTCAMIPRMKTGWIVPILDGDRIMGFVDAMETRDPDRRALDEPEYVLLSALSRVFARLWQRAESPAGQPMPAQEWVHRMSVFNNTIINPLTGIIGSVELIRHKQPDLTGETVKYLNTIERSAGKIHLSVLESLDMPDARRSGSEGVNSDDLVGRSRTIPQVTADNADPVNRWSASRLDGKAAVSVLAV